MNFAVFMVGIIVVVCALGYGAHLLGVSGTWIAIGAAVVVGFGMMAGVVKTRQKDS